MNTPDPLMPAGLEPPPASPFAVPEVVTYDPAEAAAEPAPPEPRLNRAQRRHLRHVTLADARLLARVARYDVEVRHAGEAIAAVYPTELAATYGLEHVAADMHRKSLLTGAELHRVKVLARGRRAALRGA